MVNNIQVKHKVLHFTHIDSDALGCDVVIKYSTTKEVVTYYMSNNDVDRVIIKVVNKLTGDLLSREWFSADADKVVYDDIFITDIGPSKDAVESIVKYKNTVKSILNIDCNLYGFDHHLTNTMDKSYDWFIVADNLKTFYKKYSHMFNYKHALENNFKDMYHMFIWEHDNIKDERYKSIDDVDDNTSMKISATYLVGVFLIFDNDFIDDKWKGAVISNNHVNANIAVMKLIEDISIYDTWEWKNNKYIKTSGHEDMCSVLIKMVGITRASSMIIDTIKTSISSSIIVSSYYGLNPPQPTVNYFPKGFKVVYEYLKYKSFDYVKKSLINVKMLTDDSIYLLEDALGVSLHNLNRAYISVSDNTVDLNEQATFINNYLDNEFEGNSIFMHIFVTSSTLSIRSNGTYDVASIAKALGGGGHKAAAGAKINSNMLVNIIKIYHDNAISIEEVIKKSTYVERLDEYSKSLAPIISFDYNLKVER
jgi:hypothetical protein